MTKPLSSLSEAVTCFALSLRDVLRPGLALMSIAIGAAAFSLWAVVFVVWWKNILLGVGAASSFVIGGLFSGRGAGDVPADAAATIGSTLSASLGHVFDHVLTLALFVLLVMVTMRILLELLLMTRIQRHCLKRYPELRTGIDSSVLAGLSDAVRTFCTLVFGGLLCLIIPVVGGVMLFVLASYLNVRSLVNDALEGLADDEQRRAIIKANRVQMALLGILVSLSMLVPFAGFFGPVVLGASVCHLCMRSLARECLRGDLAPSRNQTSTSA